MKETRFSVEINANKETVWDTLWQDETFRQWAGIIDPGTYMAGELKEGNEVQFISSRNGYGVTSLVEKLVANEFLLLRHSADTQEDGKSERAQEWTGGTESYSLAEKDGATTLTVAFDVPPEQEEYFKVNYPKALERVKVLAERKK
ncbi:MAG TPA: SRPBCC domain-containing protein [Patescibacteria group bacterium]|nr:SRPBCC domain-containing protein [Patescibacteria group bacterium]